MVRRELHTVLLCKIAYLSIKKNLRNEVRVYETSAFYKRDETMTKHHVVLCLDTCNKKDEYNHNTGRAIQTKIIP